MFIIKDGTGSGNAAKVTNNNKLATLAVMEGIAVYHTFTGDSYNVNTGTINLTSGSKSALFYLKNNEEYDIVLQTAIYLIGANTGGANSETLVQIERNPTGGTLVSSGTNLIPVNRNFGSSNTLNVDCYKGAEGKTLTGGTVFAESIFTSTGRNVLSDLNMILPKGASVGVTITPATSTTSQNFQIAFLGYRATEVTQ